MLDANNTYFSKLAGKDGETSGTYKALWAFRNSIARSTDELEASEYIWKYEVKDFVAALRKAGIRSFVVTTNSTSLMDELHLLQQNGCKLEGLCTIRRAETPYEDAQDINGIRFILD